MKGSTYFALAILLLAIVTVFLSLRITGFKAQFLPLTIGIALGLSALARLFVELRETRAAEGVGERIKSIPIKATSIILSAIWLIGFFLMIYLIGFPLAIFLFVTAYVRLHGRGWIKSTALGLATGGFVYLMFSYFMGLDLYRGVLWLSLSRLLP